MIRASDPQIPSLMLYPAELRARTARLMHPAHPDRPAAPGDLWLMDMRALHTAAPNASEAPRLMMTWRFLREG